MHVNVNVCASLVWWVDMLDGTIAILNVITYMIEHQSVAMPRPDSDPASLALTSDYSSSPLHRFRAGSKHAMVRTSHSPHVAFIVTY